MTKRYDCLLLDADGTIYDFSAAEDKALAAATAAMGLAIDAEQAAAYKRINEALWRAYERREVTQEALRVLRFEQFLEALGMAATHDAQEMADRFVQALGQQTDEIEGARAFMQEASARVPIIIVTNGIGQVQRSRFALSPLSRYMTGQVISGELGVAKPDPRMVHEALAIGGVSADRALMVGDVPASDIAAARAAGVDSCWFNPAGRANTTPHAPTYEVRTLHEVLQWL